jgi:hypothetical protein
MNSQEEAHASPADVLAGPFGRRGPPRLGPGQEEEGAALPADSIYKLKVKTLDGKEADLKDYAAR